MDWPDEDRRDAALERVLIRTATIEERDRLRAGERAVLLALSHGLDRREAAVALGYSLETVKVYLRDAKRILAAKTAAHAVAEAIRRGLIT